VADRLAGPYRIATLRWRLAPGDWRLVGNGVAGPLARLRISADGPLALALEQGVESPAYDVLRPAPVLVARLRAPGRWLETRIDLAD
jgi:hypothetical protein